MISDSDELGKRLIQHCKMLSENLEQMHPMERDHMLQENHAIASRLQKRPRAIRIIFEYGLDLIRHSSDTWSVSTDEESTVSPLRLQKETGFRPIVAWVSDGESKARSYILPVDYDLSEIDSSPRCITQIFNEDGPHLFPAFSFKHHIDAIAYRVLTLATHYAWQARRLHSEQSQCTLFDGARKVAFETEACITTTIRLIEGLREVYAERFGIRIPMDWDPRREGWKELLKKTTVKPTVLLERLRDAWCGRELNFRALNEYRNIIEHDHLFSGRSVATERLRLRGVGVACSLHMPDDPSKSHKDFTFNERKDALSYCWKSAVAAINVAREILIAVSEYPSPYPYPDDEI